MSSTSPPPLNLPIIFIIIWSWGPSLPSPMWFHNLMHPSRTTISPLMTPQKNSWSRHPFYLSPRRSIPTTNLSNQIFWLLHFVSIVCLLGYSPITAPFITPLMYAFQTVDKSDRELLKVSNCVNALSPPGSRLRIIMSTTGPFPTDTWPGGDPIMDTMSPFQFFYNW